jgi:hypothetical protein
MSAALSVLRARKEEFDKALPVSRFLRHALATIKVV